MASSRFVARHCHEDMNAPQALKRAIEFLVRRLEEKRNELVGDELAVLFPPHDILCPAAAIIPQRAVHETHKQKVPVEVRQPVAKRRRTAPQKRGEQLPRIIQMPRHAPMPAPQQPRPLLLPVRPHIHRLHKLRRRAQNRILLPAVRRGARGLALVVGVLVEVDAGEARDGNGGGEGGAEVDGAGDEVEGGGGVDGGEECDAAPADVEARAVVHDVEGPHVSGLPIKELRDVDELEEDGDGHGVGECAVELVLLRGEGEDDEGPDHHAEAAVGHELDVDAEDAGVELDAVVVVEGEVAGGVDVGGGGEVGALDVEEEREDDAEEVRGAEEVAELVVHDRGVEDAEVQAENREECHGDKVHGKAVVFIVRDVPLRRHGSVVLLPRHGDVQHDLQRDKPADDFPSDRGPECDGAPRVDIDRHEEAALVEALEEREEGAVEVGVGVPEKDDDDGREEEDEQRQEGAPEEDLEAGEELVAGAVNNRCGGWDCDCSSHDAKYDRESGRSGVLVSERQAGRRTPDEVVQPVE
mmetsp:Transcript_10876/g.27357  ORF Transcript_10876/g.27357 Transcript_10876/m.27357 type:complete len:526 (+) Transcript_10876:404-1981(+)